MKGGEETARARQGREERSAKEKKQNLTGGGNQLAVSKHVDNISACGSVGSYSLYGSK